jgi:hypothetical protein
VAHRADAEDRHRLVCGRHGSPLWPVVPPRRVTTSIVVPITPVLDTGGANNAANDTNRISLTVNGHQHELELDNLRPSLSQQPARGRDADGRPANQDGEMIETAAAHEPDADSYAEILLLDKQIEELLQGLADLIEDMRDWEDGGTATRLIEEQEAVIEALDRRRSELLERLAQTRSR